MSKDSIPPVTTKELAKIFRMSDRRVLQLLDAGVIEATPESGRNKLFDLEIVIPQYSHFLIAQAAGGPAVEDWAPTI